MIIIFLCVHYSNVNFGGDVLSCQHNPKTLNGLKNFWMFLHEIQPLCVEINDGVNAMSLQFSR